METLLIFGVALTALLFGIGVMNILFDIYRVPTFLTSTALSSSVNRARRKRNAGSRFDRAMESLAGYISGKIRLNDSVKRKLEGDLSCAGMKITPEMHVANCILKASIAAAVTFPPAFIFSPAVILPPLAALAVFSSEYSAPSKKIEAHREAIEYELPLLVSRISNTLESGRSRDVLYILNSYRRNAGPDLAAELAVTVADMQSGNARAALTRLESRVGSSLLSDVSRGLIAVMDGNDPVGYWASLSARLTDNQRQILQRKANRFPGRINRLSFCLLACVMILYLVVIGTEIVQSFGVIFG